MARRSKNIGSIKAISANFDFSPNPASRLVGGWIVDFSAKYEIHEKLQL